MIRQTLWMLGLFFVGWIVWECAPDFTAVLFWALVAVLYFRDKYRERKRPRSVVDLFCKQIGNAVPISTATALCRSVLHDAAAT